MSKPTFFELLSILKDNITKKNTPMRDPIPPEERLVIFLRYLATGCSFADLHNIFRVGKSTVSKIVKQICDEIWFCLKHITIPENTAEKWLEISTGFEDYANFPHCIGAIDGKHIRMIRPPNSASTYYSHKNYLSIVLLAMCDVNYLFTYIDVGTYGRCNDTGIFKNSMLYEKLNSNLFNIPPTSTIRDSATEYPYVIVGNEAFSLSDNLLRPYGGKKLTDTKKIFNFRLTRARKYIERTFDILANKWRIFHRPIDVDIDLAANLIKSACILHNFVRARDGACDDNIPTCSMQTILDDTSSRGHYRALACRDAFSDYFVDVDPLDCKDIK